MKKPLGDSLSVFLCFYDNYLRRNGLNDVTFAEMISETEWTIRSVRAHELEPPQKMLEVVGWCKFESTYEKTVLATETRYMEKSEIGEHE